MIHNYTLGISLLWLAAYLPVFCVVVLIARRFALPSGSDLLFLTLFAVEPYLLWTVMLTTWHSRKGLGNLWECSMIALFSAVAWNVANRRLLGADWFKVPLTYSAVCALLVNFVTIATFFLIPKLELEGV